MKKTLSWSPSGGTAISSLPSVPASSVSMFVAVAMEGYKPQQNTNELNITFQVSFLSWCNKKMGKGINSADLSDHHL